MKLFFLSALMGIAATSFATAQTKGVAKIECVAAKDGVTTIVEIDYETRSIRQWAKFGSAISGPFGPYGATITPATVVWRMKDARGRAEGLSTSTLDRRRRTLSVQVDHGSDEERFQRLNTPCKDAPRSADDDDDRR